MGELVKMQTSALTIFNLPDPFMLSVFKFMSISERLNLMRVCKKWYNYAHDPSLWRVLDLTRFKLSLFDAKAIVERFGTVALHKLYLNGTYDENKLIESCYLNEHIRQLNYLDEEFMQVLVNKCKNLDTISIEYINLENVKMSMFLFKHLKELNLKWCNFTIMPKTSGAKIQQFLSMTTLKLIRLTTQLTSQDIELISKTMPNLVNLTVNEAKSSFNDNCVRHLLNLFKLEKLELINTLITDQAVEELAKSVYLKMNLKVLNISMNLKLTNVALELIGVNFLQLISLNVTSCFGFTNISHIENLKNLKYINVNNTSIEKRFIVNFIQNLSHICEVEYNHEKVLIRKNNWTINGSKNCVCSF